MTLTALILPAVLVTLAVFVVRFKRACDEWKAGVHAWTEREKRRMVEELAEAEVRWAGYRAVVARGVSVGAAIPPPDNP